MLDTKLSIRYSFSQLLLCFHCSQKAVLIPPALV
jgi:hypothetical protein